VLRKTFGHKGEPQQILSTYWADEMDGASVTYGERGGVYSVLVGK
jgi:hypothetical protein